MGACDYTQGDESIANHEGFPAERTPSRNWGPHSQIQHAATHEDRPCRDRLSQAVQADRGIIGPQQNRASPRQLRAVRIQDFVENAASCQRLRRKHWHSENPEDDSWGDRQVNEAKLCHGTAVMAEEVCMPLESKV
jgi:hypothetical protein